MPTRFPSARIRAAVPLRPPFPSSRCGKTRSGAGRFARGRSLLQCSKHIVVGKVQTLRGTENIAFLRPGVSPSAPIAIRPASRSRSRQGDGGGPIGGAEGDEGSPAFRSSLHALILFARAARDQAIGPDVHPRSGARCWLPRRACGLRIRQGANPCRADAGRSVDRSSRKIGDAETFAAVATKARPTRPDLPPRQGPRRGALGPGSRSVAPDLCTARRVSGLDARVIAQGARNTVEDVPRPTLRPASSIRPVYALRTSFESLSAQHD